MDIVALRLELTEDPLGRGYAAMTDAEAADSLNDTLDRSIAVSELDPTSIFEAIDASEFSGLTEAQKENVRWVTSLPTVKIGPDSNGRAVLLDAFGAGTTTRANLVALATKLGSRAEELGLGRVTHLDVAEARRG